MSQLTRQEWEQVQSLFHRAVEHGDGFAPNEGDTDPRVLAEARRLIQFHRRSGSFLDPPSLPRCTTISVMPELEATHQAGDLFGAFRLISRIDAGGMGEVWLAQRSDPRFRQTVAVKILRTSHNPALLQRFFDERAALARLEHPSITRLIDGGVSPDGEPYLVMEYVDGRPIDKYLVDNQLTIHQRIEMFIRICEAVEFAHQNLIIHCDLKPSNILVSSDGRPRVLDFGICRLLQNVGSSESSDGTQSPALTPQFASPEQLRGEPCTTRSDVYSLGLILLQMLHPAAPPEAGLLTRIGNPQSRVQHAELSPNILGRRWKDTVWVIRKATQASPPQRYASVRALNDDLQRVLGLRPVIARPPNRVYRLERWARRNAILATFATVLTLSLSVGVAGVVRAWQRESREHRTALAATEFLEDLLGSSTPWALQRDKFSLAFLEEASRHAANELHHQPAVELRVRMSLARIYASLWEWPPVLREARRAEQLARQLEGDESESLADALTLVGRAQTWLRDPDATRTQGACLALRDKLYPATHPKIAESYINLGFAQWWTTPRTDWDLADRNYRKGIELFRKSGDSSLGDFARALYSYANFGRSFGLPASSLLDLARESVDMFERSKERPSRYSRSALLTFAQLIVESKDPFEAVPHLKRFLNEYGENDFVDNQPRIAAWLLAMLTHLQGDKAVALAHYKLALAGQVRLVGARWGENHAANALEALERADDPSELSQWVDQWLLRPLDRCDPEVTQLLIWLTWPVLLDGSPVESRKALDQMVVFASKSCPHNELLQTVLRLSQAEAIEDTEGIQREIGTLTACENSLPCDFHVRLVVMRAMKETGKVQDSGGF